MNRYLAGYLAAAFVMVALDMAWLGVIAKPIYQQGIGHLLAEKPDVYAALAFYAVYPLGIVIFVLAPNMDAPALRRAAISGALFGIFAYATYDLSNLATLKEWPFRLTCIDMAWGTVASALASVSGKAAMNRALDKAHRSMERNPHAPH
jgi:uncharacterized membrane protein